MSLTDAPVWAGLAAVYALAAVAAATSGALAWRRRRRTAAATALTVLMAALGLWCLADVVITLAGAGRLGLGGPASVAVARVALAVTLPLIAVSVAAFWLVARSVADPTRVPGRREQALLAVHPVLMAAGAAVSPWSAVLYRPGGFRPDGLWLDWEVGPAFLLHALLSYGLLTATAVVFARARRRGGPLQRRQLGLLLLALLVPLPGNVLITLLPSAAAPDLTGIGFALSGLLTSWALLRHGLLDLVPVARALVLEHLADAVLVLDAEGRTVDANRAARTLLEQVDAQRLAGSAGELRLDAGPDRRPVVLDVRADPLHDTRGAVLGTVVVARDITELAVLRDRLAEAAVRDGLTGLHNRRHLDAAIAEELARAVREGTPLSVVMVDVDHFKSVNDRYGHAVGDELLVAVGWALARSLRPEDVLARFGGEEFVLLLPGAGLEAALERADRLRIACATATVPGPSGPVQRTVSVGVAALRTVAARCGGTERVTPEDLLQAADEALYRAKESGRDRVVAAGARVG